MRIQAARAASLAQADSQVDVATFIAWVDAYEARDKGLATFYLDRLRPEFRAAFDAWIATSQFDRARTQDSRRDAGVPGRGKRQADQFDRAAEVLAAEARRDIQRASNYVLSVVLYAVVLFFAGISTKIGNRRLRTLTIICG